MPLRLLALLPRPTLALLPLPNFGVEQLEALGKLPILFA
jgi:hypothetical protein